MQVNDECGNFFSVGYVEGMRMVGMHLGPRNKMEYPYSYDPILVFETSGEATGSAYSDRLRGWYEPSVLKEAKIKHLGKDTDYFSGISAKKIESLLRDLMGKPDLKLITIEEHCNQSSGFPVWYFAFQEPEEVSKK
jgi:hypothetical protein